MARSWWATVLVLMALLLGAVYFLLYQGAGTPASLEVAAVPPGDQEVAWLHPATTPYTWERFVAGLQFLARRQPTLGLTVDVHDAFPAATTTMASVGLRRTGFSGTLWIRWYKLTGQQGQSAWLDLLSRRQPPPLAIVGGGSSDRARALAELLDQQRRTTGYAPPLLITTATANTVFASHQEEKPLLDLYPGHSFRCCFSNRQMAEATLDFVFSQPDLRPTDGPAFLAFWEDDPYSRDLMDQCRALLWQWQTEPAASPLRRRGTLADVTFVQVPIRHSVGPVTEPNPPEALAVQKLVEEMTQATAAKRALLWLPGEVKPVRRVLRALVQAAPALAPRLVVAIGDAVDFNTIFRDRHLTWPIQALPCDLVLFCHHNPVLAAAGFAAPTGRALDLEAASSGTHDLLLYADVGAMLVEAAFQEQRLLASPETVLARLKSLKDEAGRPRFDARGERPGGVDEFLVLLRPLREGALVLPKAAMIVSQRVGPEGVWRTQRQFLVEDDMTATPPPAPRANAP